MGISCEKPTPNDRETPRLRRDQLARHSNDPVENRGYGAGIPTRIRLIRFLEHDYSRHPTTSS